MRAFLNTAVNSVSTDLDLGVVEGARAREDTEYRRTLSEILGGHSESIPVWGGKAQQMQLQTHPKRP